MTFVSFFRFDFCHAVLLWWEEVSVVIYLFSPREDTCQYLKCDYSDPRSTDERISRKRSEQIILAVLARAEAWAVNDAPLAFGALLFFHHPFLGMVCNLC